MADRTRWSQDTLNWICCNKQVIKDIAEKLGVPPEAIAGIMAKENNWYRYGPDPHLQYLADQYAYARTFDYSHSDWQQESVITRDMGPTRWEKGMLPSLIDAGLANFQIATAIRLLEWYKPYMQLHGDKLGLEPYVNDYNELVRTLTRGDYACGGEGVRLTAALYGLMVAEALAFFETHADPAYWNSLSQKTKDAIVVTYCSKGKNAIENEWKRKTNWTPETGPQLPYKPAPGEGQAGGEDHEYNAREIGRVMQSPGYGGFQLPPCARLDEETCEIKKVPCGNDPRPPWNSAPRPASPPRRDPLVLDLDGDGIETTIVTGRAHFDHDGDSFSERTGWVGPDDGLLAMDRNGDGIINDGKELFGNQTILGSGRKAANGFEALAEFDGNGDGRIDSADPAFAQLRVWRDSDGDGFSLPGELHTLDELGIKSINLDSTVTNSSDAQGNIQNRLGTFENVNGTLGQMAEYTLQRDMMDTFPNELLPIPEEIAALPDLQGYGNVHDLHQAMVRDASAQLKSTVEQFMAETDVSARNALMDRILFEWTGTGNIDPWSRGAFMDARKLAVLEKLFGESFAGSNGPNPTYNASVPLNESYRRFFELMYSELMAQTHLKDLYGKITYTWNNEEQQYDSDMSGVMAHLQTQLAADPEQGKLLLSEFARSMRGLGHDRVSCLPCREFFIMQDPELGWVIDTGGLPVYDQLGQGDGWWYPHMWGTWNSDAVKGSPTEGDGWINGLSGDDVIYGTGRNEHLFNQNGDALLYGGGGNDQIWAGEGNDILDGGPGNDRLYGEAGNDTYIFRRGSGQDIIVDADPTPNNTDTIWLGSNLTPEDVILRRNGNNLVQKIIDTTDTLTVQDYFRNDSPLNRIEQIQFMDGTLWTHEDILIEIVKPSVAEGAWVRASEWNAGFCHALGGEPGALRESFGWGAGGSIAG